MKKIKGLGAMLLAGLLVIPGNLGLAGQVLAQSDAKTTLKPEPLERFDQTKLLLACSRETNRRNDKTKTKGKL